MSEQGPDRRLKPATAAKPLEGKTAVVTGATRGIGRATVEELLRLGARVLAVSRSEDDLRAIRGELGVDYVAADLSRAEECTRMIEEAERQLGRIDVLVNNAGLGSAGEPRIWEHDPETWRERMAINLDAPFHLTRLAVPGMIERRFGRIVFVSSTVAQVAYPAPAYCASKAGALGMMRATAVNVGPYGITANAVLPGSVRTEMAEDSAAFFAERRGLTVEEVWEKRAGAYPAGRVLDPPEVAAAIGFLATPAASGINGEGIVVALGGLR